MVTAISKPDNNWRIFIQFDWAIVVASAELVTVVVPLWFEPESFGVLFLCFAFVGPYLPLDTHFAIGNFINNVIKNEDIVITGDGSTTRSYMYASDLSIAIWKILLIGNNNKPYNVGVDNAYSLKEIALMLKKKYGNDVQILNTNKDLPKNVYVPNIDTLINELEIKHFVQIEEAIQKTIKFNTINE